MASTLAQITLDTLLDNTPNTYEDIDRAAAIDDLLEDADLVPVPPSATARNIGKPETKTRDMNVSANGPYALHLGFESNRLGIRLRNGNGDTVAQHLLSLTPFKQPLRTYYELCQAYEQAARKGPPDRIEILDRARRHQHNELAALARERLAGKLVMGHDTARRLMTLVSRMFYGTDYI